MIRTRSVVATLFSTLAIWTIALFVIAILIRLLVTDPSTQVGGPLTDAATREAFNAVFNLNRPLLIDSADRSLRLLIGDWGISWRSRLPVTEIVLPAAVLSITLALLATVLGIALSLLAIIDLLQSETRSAIGVWRFGSTISLLAAAVPSFVLGLWIVSSPVPDWLDLPRYGFASAHVSTIAALALPAVCLGIVGVGFGSPRIRAVMREVQASTWYMQARSCGFTVPRATIRQGGPFLLSALGDVFAQIYIASFTGAVAVEYVFGLPGLGTVLVDAVQLGDVPVLMGVVAVSTAVTFLVLAIRVLFTLALPSHLRAGGAS